MPETLAPMQKKTMTRWTKILFLTAVLASTVAIGQTDTSKDNDEGFYKIKLQILCLDRKPLIFDTVTVNGQICITDSIGNLQVEIKWENHCYGLFKKYKKNALTFQIKNTSSFKEKLVPFL